MSGDLLGVGALGRVTKAVYLGEQVAVKTVHFRGPVEQRLGNVRYVHAEIGFGRLLHSFIARTGTSEEDSHVCACKRHCEYLFVRSAWRLPPSLLRSGLTI
jgi:hypothetical protein